MPHVAIQGLELYYERHGGKRGTPLVLVSGSGGTCKGWLALQVPEFAKRRPVLIFDHPGAGRSQPYPGGFSTRKLAETTDALLDALEISKADFLGAFMGGMVIQQLALRFPERARRLVLVGTYARADAKRRLLLTQWSDLSAAGAPAEIQVRDRLLWTLSTKTLEQADLIDSMLKNVRDDPPMTADTFQRQCKACAEHDILDELHEVRAKVLVICGQNDRLTPPRLHRELVEALPEARLVTFPFAAHLVMLESAQSFNQTVLEFLAE